MASCVDNDTVRSTLLSQAGAAAILQRRSRLAVASVGPRKRDWKQMTEFARFRISDTLDAVVRVEPLELEHLSATRHVHAASFRLMSGSFVTAAQCDAYSEHLLSPAYTDELMSAVQAERLIGAWIDRELVGTAGWIPDSGARQEQGQTAELSWVYVRPMFTDCGIGRRLVSDVELRARRAGCDIAAIRSSTNAVEFFENMGYRTTRRGLQPLGRDQSLPVVFMRKSLAHPGLTELTRH